MNMLRCASRNLVLALGTLLTLSAPASAEAPPSFTRDVKPFLGRYCVECHNTNKVKGGLVLESFKSLMQGGKTGPVVEPGKPEDSLLVLFAEHKEKPFMPPA